MQLIYKQSPLGEVQDIDSKNGIVKGYASFFDNKDSDNEGKAEIIVAKQRNGPTGTVEAAFISRYTRFENLAANVEPPF